MRNAWLYELIDPRTRRRAYIGCTTNPGLRLQQHLAGKCRTTRPWVMELMALKRAPIMRLKRVSHEAVAFRMERAWIRAARARGEAILNRN